MTGDRWGTTATEIEARYACDDHVAEPTLAAWRAVTIHAPAEVVWLWLIQVRAAPYSYDWIDNGGRRSPERLLNLSDPVPGDPFTASRGRPLGSVLSVSHHQHLTGQIMGAVLSYRLDELAPNRSRLVLKVVGAMPRLAAAPPCVADLVMARRQLLTFKKYAEASTRG